MSEAGIRFAAARGPHTSGWAHFDGDRWQLKARGGRLKSTTRPSAKLLVGHSRLATCGRRPGDLPPVDEAQPYIEHEYLIAHNGTIPADVVELYHLRGGPALTVDSMVLLEALVEGIGPMRILERCDAPQALVWAVAGVVRVCRMPGARGPAHPLYRATGQGWEAVSSGPMPGSELLPESVAVEVGRGISG